MSQTPTQEPLQNLDSGDWAIYQCPHGCLHVRLNNLTLTFTGSEFQRLTRLLVDASARLVYSRSPPRTTAH